jgi:EmrB/QacA subfamily drug resistance transporter
MSDPESRSRLLLPVTLAAVVVYGFDTNVVNVALPALQHELDAGPVALELVVGGYAFTYATGLVTGGRLGDLLGHRRMFLIGLAAFTAASVLCGIAGTSAELVTARLLQGLAAAAMVPQVLALITTNFAGAERLRALAWFGVSGAVSGVLGQVAGGLLLVADVFGLGWRAVFLLNLPVGVAVCALAHRVLPRAAPVRRPAFDPVGVVAVSGALALALVPLVVGRGAGWPWWTFVLLTAAVPAAAFAVAWERRLARRGGNPVLDLTLFRERTFTAGLGVAVAFMAFFAGNIFVTSLLLQNGLGLTPLQAGLAFVPFCLLGVAAPLLGGRLVAALGPASVIRIGCALDAAAVLLLAVLLSTGGTAVPVPLLVAGLALIGLGNTLVLPTYLGVVLSAVRPEQAGAASGTLNTTQQFAGVTGLAVIGTVFFAALGAQPHAAQYAGAAATTLWADLALVAAMAALTTFLPRREPSGRALRMPSMTDRGGRDAGQGRTRGVAGDRADDGGRGSGSGRPAAR